MGKHSIYMLKNLKSFGSVLCLKKTVCVIFFALACVALIYRIQIKNGFSVLAGDKYDAVISASVLEHWYQVFCGQVWWSNVSYFFPYKNTIAQTDAFFLASLPYSIFRAIGLEPLLSQSFAGVTLRFFGYIFFYFFSRKSLGLKFGASLFGACLFTLMASSVAFISRPQLSSIVFAPLLAYLIHETIRGLKGRNKIQYTLNGVLATALFSLWCLTCFYLAWFNLYFLCVFVLFFALLPNRSELRDVLKTSLEYKWLTLTILLSGVFFGLPFLFAFLPKSIEVGVRSWSDVSTHLVRPWDIFLMIPESVGGGGIVSEGLGPNFSVPNVIGQYGRLGFSPMIVLGTALAGWLSVKNWQSIDKMSPTAFVAVCSIFFCVVSVTKFGEFSFWYYIYSYFPGAKALDVASIMMIFLIFPVSGVMAWLIDKIAFDVPVLLLMAVSFITFELSTPYINLNRIEESELMNVPKPPSYCASFFVDALRSQINSAGSLSSIESIYPHNVAAMYIAQRAGIPTINGFASFNPPGWDMGSPERKDYKARVDTYIHQFSLKNVCELNIEGRTWSAYK